MKKLKSIILLFALTLSVMLLPGCAKEIRVPDRMIQTMGLPLGTELIVTEEMLIKLGIDAIYEKDLFLNGKEIKE